MECWTLQPAPFHASLFVAGVADAASQEVAGLVAGAATTADLPLASSVGSEQGGLIRAHTDKTSNTAATTAKSDPDPGLQGATTQTGGSLSMQQSREQQDPGSELGAGTSVQQATGLPQSRKLLRQLPTSH